MLTRQLRRARLPRGTRLSPKCARTGLSGAWHLCGRLDGAVKLCKPATADTRDSGGREGHRLSKRPWRLIFSAIESYKCMCAIFKKFPSLDHMMLQLRLVVPGRWKTVWTHELSPAEEVTSVAATMLRNVHTGELGLHRILL